jgi:hypothetical protein
MADNSGTERLQVNYGDDCKKNQKEKNREEKKLSFILLCLYMFFMMCFIKNPSGSFPP